MFVLCTSIKEYTSKHKLSVLYFSTGHTYGTITNTMEIITTGKKGKHLNTLEKYHIYKVSKNNLHMNDINIDTYNPIFKELYNTITSPTSPHSSQP
jgi:hypothetical protein